VSGHRHGREIKDPSGKTQNELVLEDLKAGKIITMLSALNDHHIGRLASRINDLKNQGYGANIVSFKRVDQGWQSYKWVDDPAQYAVQAGQGQGPQGLTPAP